MTDEISRRNTEGVMQTLRRVETMVCEQKLALDRFSDHVAELMRRVNALEQAEAMRKIAAVGTGPTQQQ